MRLLLARRVRPGAVAGRRRQRGGVAVGVVVHPARPGTGAGGDRCGAGRHGAAPRRGGWSPTSAGRTALLRGADRPARAGTGHGGAGAVAEERSRIARELHDVIGHEVTVIALQADAAAAALAKAPERAAAPIEAIRAVGDRGAGRDAPGRRACCAPPRRRTCARSRGSTDVADARGAVAGRRRTGRPDPATPGRGRRTRACELAAYRRGPGGAHQRAAARARRTGRRPRRRGRRRGAGRGGQPPGRRPCPSPGRTATGFGLVGMRERVRLLGGRLDAGPTDGGGFALTARLPLELPRSP